ncbi:Gfo/Idh/MocA family oxidoreductase [Pasteurellaceae bacterium LIM206]|nr:Gfo/Idh/MocA family oxidoreductase [Pasteurellaceae bacterium LIM206]
MTTIRYGVVGVGYFGADLARFMNDIEGAEIIVVYDPENGETIANELHCDAAQSLDELVCRDDVDCVIVATPNYLHKEPVIKAAQHKKHVFCEKPIALSYKECDEMVKACEQNGVIFMAGHIMNFFNGVHHAKELINQGVIGDVLYCHTARNGWEDKQPTISWKKIREKSGGHLYHHIHELDCVQFLMGGMPKNVVMNAGNVAHKGEKFGNEDDMLFVCMEFENSRFAVLEWGSAFRWGEHYVLIQGTKGAIKLDMYHCKGTLRVDGKDSYFLIHENQAEDDDRTRIYTSTEMDGAIQYGHPGKRTPLWLSSIMKKEMTYLNDILHGMQPSEEFVKLLTGEAARAAIATADACTKSRLENRKVELSEILNS